MLNPSNKVKKRARTDNGYFQSPAKNTPALCQKPLAQPDGHVDHDWLEPSSTPAVKESLLLECGFLRPHTPGLTAIAVTPDGERMAVARTDYSILYSRKLRDWTPTDEILPRFGDPDQSVSCLQFTPCSNFLVAGRLNGTVTFWKIFKCGLALHAELRPGGGAVWNMQFSPGCSTSCFRLAVACDDGAVRIISPDPEFSSETLPTDEAHYIIKQTSKAQARALSLTWVPNNHVASQHRKASWSSGSDEKQGAIVSGDSEGGLRLLCAQSGRVLMHGKIPSSEDRPVLIWTVQSVCKGQKIVCGDDRGNVTIWDASSMTMVSEMTPGGVKGAIWTSTVLKRTSDTIEKANWKSKGSSNQCRADIPKEMVVFGCANGRICGVQFLDDKGTSLSTYRGAALHTHDVRGIVGTRDGHFMSASIDSKVTCAPLEWFGSIGGKVKHIHGLNNLIGRSSIQVVNDHNIVVCRGSREIEIWYLPEGEDGFPKLLLRMKFDVGSDLRTCSLSHDCQFLALSDADSFRLYRVWDGVGESPGIAASFGKVDIVDTKPSIEASLSGCVSVLFCRGSLVALSRNRMGIIIYDLQSERHSYSDMKDWDSKGLFLKFVACGRSTIAAVDTNNQVFVCKLSSKDIQWQADLRTPYYVKNPVSFSLSPSGQKVAFALSDGSLFVSKTKFSTKKNQNATIFGRSGKSVITCLTFGKSEKNLLVSGLYHSSIISLEHGLIDESGNTIKAGSKKRKRYHDDAKNKQALSTKINSCDLPLKENARLFGNGIPSGGRILLLVQNMDLLESDLPDAIPSKRFTSRS